MDQSIYKYVNKFPEFNSIISENYKNLDTSDKTECQSFKGTKLSQHEDDKNMFIDTCSKFSKHHEEIIKKAETSKNALCKYINYWIYDTLNSMQGFDHKELLKDFYGKIQNLKFCKTNRNPISESTYKELKELSKLYASFIKFKQESTKKSSPTCNEAGTIFQLYEESAGKCKWNYNNYFCWELMKFRVDYEHNRLHAKSCKDQMKPLTPIGNDILPTILFPFVVMSLISFVFMFLYNFTSFDSWLRSKLPGAKKETKKKVHRMHELQRTSEMEGRRYKLPYHSSR